MDTKGVLVLIVLVVVVVVAVVEPTEGAEVLEREEAGASPEVLKVGTAKDTEAVGGAEAEAVMCEVVAILGAAAATVARAVGDPPPLIKCWAKRSPLW